MMMFSVRLKELRTERNLTLSQLGKAIGVSHSAIEKWEKNLRSAAVVYLYKLAIYFNVSADYLLGLTDDMDAK